jgi:hypothetical protein
VSAIPTLRDIAVVIIALEVFIMLLIPAVILYFSVKGISWVQKQVQKFGPMVRFRFAQAAQITEEFSHKAAAPVIVTSASVARVKRVRATLAASLSILSTREV